MTECESVDRTLPERLLHGFSTVGDIERSQQWPLFMKDQDVMPIERVLPRAWEIRKKIVSRANAVPVSDNLRAIWDAAIDDQDGEGPRFGRLVGRASASARSSDVLKIAAVMFGAMMLSIMLNLQLFGSSACW